MSPLACSVERQIERDKAIAMKRPISLMSSVAAVLVALPASISAAELSNALKAEDLKRRIEEAKALLKANNIKSDK